MVYVGAADAASFAAVGSAESDVARRDWFES